VKARKYSTKVKRIEPKSILLLDEQAEVNMSASLYKAGLEHSRLEQERILS